MKVKTFKKRLDDIQTNVVKHMDQYVEMFQFFCNFVTYVFCGFF